MPDVDLPNVVATKTFLNQTASLVLADVFTPTVAGLFRVSGYLEESSGGVGLTAVVKWTDDNRAQTAGGVLTQMMASLQWSSGAPVTLRSAANQSISVSVDIGTNTVTYSLYVVVEQME